MTPARPHRLTLADLINEDEDRKPVLPHRDADEDDDVLKEIVHPPVYSRLRVGQAGPSRSRSSGPSHGQGKRQGQGRRTGSQGRHVAPGVCDFCGCTQTVMWRRPDMPDGSKARVCNACGLYWIEHGVRRDPSVNAGRRPRRPRAKRTHKGYPEDVEGATLLLALAKPKGSSPDEGSEERDATPGASTPARRTSPPVAGPSSRPDYPPSSPFSLSPSKQDAPQSSQTTQTSRSFWRPMPPPSTHPPGGVAYPQGSFRGHSISFPSPTEPIAVPTKRAAPGFHRPREEHSPTSRTYHPALLQSSPSAYSNPIFAPRRPPASPYSK